MLKTIISRFSIPGTFVRSGRFGSGLINDTYLCEFDDAGKPRKFILQRINASVFTHPEKVMQNVETVTTHIVKRLRTERVAEPYAVTPALISTRGGRSFLLDDNGAYWRVFHFIETGIVFDTVQNRKHAYEVGRGVGRFQALVSDLPPSALHDTLPGFHYTPKYLAAYDDAADADVAGRVAGIGPENTFVFKRRRIAPTLTDLIASKELPLRVVHNDPKVNNIMVQKESGEALCMLDLDTVKPGIVHFDFGDCVRSAANPAGENAKDLESIGIDMVLFEAIAEGYLREAGVFLTKTELALLPQSVKVITFELGLRFLTDYLRGDAYFKIKYPTHNLHRARVQFRLLESIEAAEGRMTSFIKRLFPFHR
ncbi:MAG: aminoglycoside phosphotransferase family protein [Nitrospirota bacterium]